MKKLVRMLALTGVVLTPALTQAADAPASPHTFTGNVGVTTDYVFRGITQSQHSPAVSAGLDYSHASGLYLGTWLSNQKWVETSGTNTTADLGYKTNSSLEWDVYGGYRGAFGDIGYDIGLIEYYYPGDKVAGNVSPDTTEAYLSLSWKTITLKYSNAISDYFIGWGTSGVTKTQGSDYLELNASYDLGNGWGVLGHIGHQAVENVSVADYTDWKIGVTKDVGFGTVTLAYTDTDANAAAAYTWDGKDVSEGVLALSFSKSF